MIEPTHTRIWTLLAAVTVAGALASVGRTAASAPIPFCQNDADCGCTQTNCSAPGQGGICVLPPPNSSQQPYCQCNPGYGGFNCEPLGACCGVEPCRGQANTICAGSALCSDLTAAECLQFNGTFAGNGTTCSSDICEPTATSTVTATATATPTNTPAPQGGSCTDASQCAPGLFCSDQVCCDTACAGPQVSCNQPGQVGTCAAIAAQAPAASNGGLLLMLGTLIAVGLGAMALRRRAR